MNRAITAWFGTARDITERKRAQERQEFLLKLSDSISSLAHSHEIEEVAMQMLGEHLGTTRAFYFFTEPKEDGNWIHIINFDYRSDPVMPSHVGRHSVRDFGLGLFDGAEHGRVVQIDDVTKVPELTAAQIQKYLAIDVVAFVNVPLIKYGSFVAGIGAHYPSPHPWQSAEIELIREVAERTWEAVERARAEEATGEARARLQLALDATHMGTFVWYPQEDRGEPDEQMLALFGLTPDDTLTLAQAVDSLIYPDDRARYADAIARAMAPDGNGRLQEDIRVVFPDGSLRWLAITGQVYFDEGTPRRPVRMPGTAIDISQSKLAEESLRESEARFHILTDAIPQVIWANDAEGKANYFNSRWFEYSGIAMEQSLVVGWQGIVHPDDAPASVERWGLALAEGVVFDTEYRLRRADGIYRWHIGRTVPLHDQDGHVIGWFGSATDIEDFKEAQLAVRQNEERLRFAIDAGGLGTCDWDYQAGLMWGNDQRFQLYGLSPSQEPLTVQQFLEAIHPDDREATWNSIIEQITEKGEYHAEYRINRPDDGTRLITEAGRIIEWQGTEPARVASILSDITQQREAQEVLRRSHEELEYLVAQRTRELALTLERMLAAEAGRTELMRRMVNTQEEERGRISRELHDNLGQHLTAVMFGLQALESQISAITISKDTSEVPQLDTLRAQVDSLMRAAHDQARQLRPAELDAMGLEAALSQYVRDWSERGGVEVDFQASGWEERPEIEIETTLYRVVQEALTNVARHAGATMVSVILERNQNMAMTIIEDDGCGFDTEKSTERLGVLGMKERLELVGGTLEIESIPNDGTTVFARIPLNSNSTGG